MVLTLGTLVLNKPANRVLVYFLYKMLYTTYKEGLDTNMIPKKSFYFVRHGITPWNLETRIQGSMDIDLHDIGREQARALQEMYHTLPITHIFYSPMKRTIETMQLMNEHKQVPSTPLEHLKEWHRGSLEGQLVSFAEANNHYAHDAEQEEDFFKRTVEAMHIIAQHHDGLPLIVAHAGTYRALCHYLNIPFASIANCTIVHFKAPEHPDESWTATKL